MVQAARSGLLQGRDRKASNNQDTIKPTSAPKMYFLMFDLCMVLFCPSPDALTLHELSVMLVYFCSPLFPLVFLRSYQLAFYSIASLSCPRVNCMKRMAFVANLVG